MYSQFSEPMDVDEHGGRGGASDGPAKLPSLGKDVVQLPPQQVRLVSPCSDHFGWKEHVPAQGPNKQGGGSWMSTVQFAVIKARDARNEGTKMTTYHAGKQLRGFIFKVAWSTPTSSKKMRPGRFWFHCSSLIGNLSFNMFYHLLSKSFRIAEHNILSR